MPRGKTNLSKITTDSRFVANILNYIDHFFFKNVAMAVGIPGSNVDSFVNNQAQTPVITALTGTGDMTLPN